MYYSWTNFPKHGDRPHIAPGDEVSAELLGIDEEEFQAYIDSGVVRKKKYPTDIQGNESPRERNLRVAAAMEAGNYEEPDEEEVDNTGTSTL